MVLSAIAQGVGTVLNLGAGLDTRPHRMALPQELLWIEADFPSMLEFLFSDPDRFGFFARYGFVPSELISTRQEALRVGRRPPSLSLTAPLLWPLGKKWRHTADRILGYTLLERRDP